MHPQIGAQDIPLFIRRHYESRLGEEYDWAKEFVTVKTDPKVFYPVGEKNKEPEPGI